MRVHLHGALADLHDGPVTIIADTIADAIEGVSRQLEWPRRMLVEVVGFPTEEALRSVTDAEDIDLMPVMHGGGGKWGTIAIGVALIAASFIPGIGQTVQLALLSSGIGMTITGTMMFFMKAPTVSKANDPPASKYLGNNQNTTASGTPIANMWGRVKARPHFLSINVDSNNLVFGVFPTSPA